MLEYIRSAGVGRINLMEVCGTHTMAIARAGIKRLLPENTALLSGPGCPVCVTPPGAIDAVLDLARREEVVIATYGDMIRVPGSKKGDDLALRRAGGARVRVVYSPLDAVELARSEQGSQVVFLGVGFETTAPGTAAAIEYAAARGIKNFSVFSMLKTVEPALRALIAQEGFNVQGFLCPGHVATVIGARGFDFLPRDFGLPAVVGGFEPAEIIRALFLLVRQIEKGSPACENAYPRAVREEGNPLALAAMERVFEPRADFWRGLGKIDASGLGIREEYAAFDAQRRFSIIFDGGGEALAPCRCGEVITGRLDPTGCPLFGTGCTPDEPVGPCMVSSEGACAARYKYREVD